VQVWISLSCWERPRKVRMQCKDLEPGMVLSIRKEGCKAWFLQNEDCVFPRLRIGLLDCAISDGVEEFVRDGETILYLGQQIVEFVGKGNRRVRLFYTEGKVCYVECFNVHSLELCFA
jgi:hypothetical protein